MSRTFLLPLIVAALAAGVYFWRLQDEERLDEKIAEREAVQLPDERNRSAENQPEKVQSETPINGTALLSDIVNPIAEKVRSLDDQKMRYEALEGLDERIAQLDINELVALIAQDPTLTCANSCFLAKTPTPEWIDANVVWLATKRLFEIDPVRALMTVGDSSSENESAELHNLIRYALGTWSHSNFNAAWNWLSGRVDTMYMGETKQGLLLQRYAEHDFRDAIQKAEAHDMLNDGLSYIGRSITTDDDMLAYLEASDKIPRGYGGGRRYATKMIAEKLHNTRGFSAARDFLETHSADQPWAASLAGTIASTHLREAPTEKAEWLLTQLPKRQQGTAMAKLVNNWAEIDLPAAAAWLKSQPNSQWRQEVQVSLVEAIRKVDPAAAESWKTEIETDP